MKTVILSLLITISSTSFGQKLLVRPPVLPFEPISFKTIDPSWAHDIYDSTLVRADTFNGYNEFDVVYTIGDHVHDGKLFKSHTIRNYDWMGFTVTCIDIASGELLWDRKISYSNYERQHLPYYQTFDRDGNLVIIGFRKLYPYNPREDGWGLAPKTPSKIFRLTINSTDGSIISYFSPDENPDFRFGVSSGMERWSIFGLDPRGNLEFLYAKLNQSSIVQRGYIDEDGTLVVTDSLEYSPDTYSIFHTQYAKRNDRYYALEKNTADKKNYIVAMDTSLRELSRVDISQINIKNNYISLIDFTDEYMIFGQGYSSPNNYNLIYYVLDYSGKLINVMDIKDDFFKKYNDTSVTYDKKYNKLLLVTYGLNKSAKEWNGFVDVLHYDGKTYELFKHLELNEVNRDFSVRQVITNDDDDQLIFDMIVGSFYYLESSNSIARPIGNYYSSMVAVSRQELGFLSSLTEQETLPNLYFVYPNPSSGAFQLSLDGFLGSKDIRIFDSSGRNVYVDTGVSSERVELDLSGLPSGTYVYKVYKGNKTLTSGQWVKL